MAKLFDTAIDANRRARFICSDIATYNAAKIKEGVENDTLFTLIAEEIEEGRAHYEAALTPEYYKATHFFERALVDVILARQGAVKSKIW
jgi:hypothetical protein